MKKFGSCGYPERPHRLPLSRSYSGNPLTGYGTLYKNNVPVIWFLPPRNNFLLLIGSKSYLCRACQVKPKCLDFYLYFWPQQGQIVEDYSFVILCAFQRSNYCQVKLYRSNEVKFCPSNKKSIIFMFTVPTLVITVLKSDRKFQKFKEKLENSNFWNYGLKERRIISLWIISWVIERSNLSCVGGIIPFYSVLVVVRLDNDNVKFIF